VRGLRRLTALSLAVVVGTGCVRPSTVNKAEEKAHIAQLGFRHLKKTGKCPSSVDSLSIDGVNISEFKKMLTSEYSITCSGDGRVVVQDIRVKDDVGITYPRE
jgi:hypothetical protein